MAFRIVSGIRPPHPINPTAQRWLPDIIWDAIQRCWAQTPQSRLSIHSFCQELTSSEKEQKRKISIPLAENSEVKRDVVRLFGKLISETHLQAQRQRVLVIKQSQPVHNPHPRK